ncbi:hypothetical protein P256_02315 [Acinetobacter nectaris CIP 110549]|uniref:Major facilitator superfamily (MFS) profile domain-containing protein n=1 Tax=Acinetobacter nectaris CIP 110549 TaxID=1392540 RepID=V2TN86_9GAMM|nr:MFS transporter [Acinetobacter nectaris]ESK37260.1 hypothetical protein P256_02315 [Acinetobacter nectaris CIP 110549]
MLHFRLFDPVFLNKLSTQKQTTRLSFFNLGFAMAAWAALIPYIKQKLDLDHTALGLLILCMGLGSIAAMLLTGRIIKTLGCRFIIAFSSIVFILALPLVTLLDHIPALAFLLTFLGIASGATGVAANFQGVIIEEKNKSPLMSNFHGMCSLGGLIAALTMTAFFHMGFSALGATLLISLLVTLIAVFSILGALSKSAVNSASQPHVEENEQPTQNRAIPHPIILMLGLMCFIAFLTESTALDWSGVYLTDIYHTSLSNAGLAYSFFAITMTFSRFFGHIFLKKLGEKKLIWASSLCASAGMAVVVLAPIWYLVLFGYALVGLGLSNVVPVLFSRVGRQDLVPKSQALSYVSILAYSGALSGSAIVGLIGQKTGLTFVFGLISVLLLSIAIFNSYTIVKKRRKERKMRKLLSQK